jgi:hypothetical protein
MRSNNFSLLYLVQGQGSTENNVEMIYWMDTVTLTEDTVDGNTHIKYIHSCTMYLGVKGELHSV